MIPLLEFTQLGKNYPAPQGESVIVKDFNLLVAEGEFVCIIGHSGCGKSTVLSIAMGLNDATEGGVIVAGREISGPGLDRGVVFQSPALLPWLTARENVLLALEQVAGGRSRKEKKASAEKYLALVGLQDSGDSYPDQLSAGMRQRAGIARAFALDPKVLLLDEPFSLLDVVTRTELQDELMRIWERERKTVLMVTHDVDEALLLADRIVMMTNGPAATVGEILEVSFPRPRRRFEILNQPEYERLRDRLITFLEERADIRPRPNAETKVRAPAKPNGNDGRGQLPVSEEERFVIKKYTGFNRFRKKYRVPEARGKKSETRAARR
ncbi:MAG TPA: ABC transporter ATP-binding protein [Candidatus Binatia bacterium]|jgi:nitrate ABC transporter ATP-binding subunit